MKPLKTASTLSAILTVSALSGAASAATFPADGAWIPLTQSGQGMGDPGSDGQNNGREIVGSPAEPAVFIYNDGSDFFVRLRLDAPPDQPALSGDLRPYGWGLLIDTDGDLTDYEISLLATGVGGSNRIELYQNTTKTGLGDPSDSAETELATYLWDPAPAGNGRVLLAPSTFNGNADYYLDFAIPVADLTAAGIGPNDALIFFAGTSSNGSSISVDLAGTDQPPGPNTLSLGASDPITVQGQIADSDGDGIPDATDPEPNNPFVCVDGDGDGCDDCAVTGGPPTPGNDGLDTDGDGQCDSGDLDIDNDGVDNAVDTDPSDNAVCADADDDGCDDCAVGVDGFGPLADADAANDGSDLDSDGLCDAGETAAGTNINDADSDDDGVPDGQEPAWNVDSDSDGLVNAADPDSDDDGLFDGTELGLDCSDPATDVAVGNCIADADGGSTTTDPLLDDSDSGGALDGQEDADHDGEVDPGERDPNDPSDDDWCLQDSDCGGPISGTVCDEASHLCVPGCRGEGGNGCPEDQICSSSDALIGSCSPAGSGGGGTGGEGGAGGSGAGGGGAAPVVDEGLRAEGSSVFCAAVTPGEQGTPWPAWLLLTLLAGSRLRRSERRS